MVDRMTPKQLRRIHTIYGIALAALVVVAGVLLCVGCVSIYRSGESPFTRAGVAEQLSRMAFPLLLTVAGVVGGGILSWVLPMDGKRPRPLRHRADTLRRLTDAYDMTAAPEPYATRMQRERHFRRVLSAVAVALCLLAAFPAVMWCADDAHFAGADKTADIRDASVVVLASGAVALFDGLAVTVAMGASYERETTIVKRAIAKKAVARKEKNVICNRKREAIILWSVRGVILAVAVVFIVLGVQNGGMADVLGKAIRICTECIGLG